MAYLEARSGQARAGVTHAGWCAPRFTGTVSSTPRTTAMLYDAFEIVYSLDEPSTARLYIKGSVMTPVPGQRVEIKYSTPNDVLFSGFIVRRTIKAQRATPTVWICDCVDVSWLLDQAPRPVFSVGATGVNSLMRYIFDHWAPASFSPGLVDSTLGNVDGFSADGSETFMEVVRRLAKQVTAYVRVNGYERTVDLFTVATGYEGNAAAWSNSSQIEQLDHLLDASQIRTVLRVVGGGGLCTAAATAGASTIAVDDTSMYGALGGEIIVASGTASYTGRSTASGPGSLTGVTSLTADVQQGARVRVLATEEDAAAQATLAAALGEGTGIVEHWIDDERLSDAEAHAKAIADLALFSTELQELNGDAGRDRWLRPGQLRSTSISSPVTIAEDFLVRSVTISPRAGGVVSTATGGPVMLSKRFTAARHERRSLVRLLAMRSTESPTFLKF